MSAEDDVEGWVSARIEEARPLSEAIGRVVVTRTDGPFEAVLVLEYTYRLLLRHVQTYVSEGMGQDLKAVAALLRELSDAHFPRASTEGSEEEDGSIPPLSVWSQGPMGEA